MSSQVLFQPFDKQEKFIEAVFSGYYTSLLYGGAIRGGKTYVGLAILIILCKIYPGSRWAVVRTDRNVIKKNVLPAYFKVRPSGFEQSFNHSDLVATMQNGSQILFVPESIKDDPELNKFKGFEVNGFLLEEMNEIQEKTYFKCIERAGSWIMEDMPPILIIGTCNPSQNWVKARFYDPYMAGNLKAPNFYLPAKITDNPYVPASYLASLKQSLPEELYKRFVDGDWDASDDIQQLINWKTIHACKMIRDSDDELITLGVDVGRYGPDKSVFLVMKGPNIIYKDQFDKTDVVMCATKTKELIERFKIKHHNVGIDSVGVGAGVVDILMSEGIIVSDLNGGRSPIDLVQTMYFEFRNLRAQMAWKLRTDMIGDNIGNIAIDNNVSLMTDIGAVWYKIAGSRKIQIEDKDEIRKRIGRSPDDFDALMYANWVRSYYGPGIAMV